MKNDSATTICYAAQTIEAVLDEVPKEAKTKREHDYWKGFVRWIRSKPLDWWTDKSGLPLGNLEQEFMAGW